jgi:gliding motility-associated lipoprotein GldB
MRNLLILFISTSLFYSCDQNNSCEEHPSIETSEIEISFDRLEDTFLSIKTKDALVNFMQQEPTVTKYFLRGNEYPNDSIMIQVLLQRLNNPHLDTLRQEVNRVFENITDIKLQFTEACGYVKHYYPDFTIPKIKTIATGFDNDLYISDSLIIIGLDYYLGNGAKFRPIDFPEYILNRYQKEYIVPSCMLLYGISPRFNSTNMKDRTMLAEMIDYGKSFYFAKKMLPCTPDSLIIWYSNEELKDTKSNEDLIWAHFLDNELLYNTNTFIKQKYLSERPKTFEIGDKCPGRIGTWLGWKILNQYADRNPSLSLHDIMKKNNAQEVFTKSKYRPGK